MPVITPIGPTDTPTPSGGGASGPNDADGDGIVDSQDNCPFTSGLGTRFGGRNGPDGCPVDSDSDGINDGLDRCPFTAGTSANNGCPTTNNNNTQPTTAPPTPTTVQLPALPGGNTCSIATQSLTEVNIRQQPTTSSSIIDRMDPENVYTGIEQAPQSDGTWYRLSSGGWVAGFVVRTNTACVNLPVAGQTAPTQVNPTAPPLPTSTPTLPPLPTATPTTQQVTLPAPNAVRWSDLPNVNPLNAVFSACQNDVALLEPFPPYIIASLSTQPDPCEAAQEELRAAVLGDAPETAALDAPIQAVMASDTGDLFLYQEGALQPVAQTNTQDNLPALNANGNLIAHVRGQSALNLLNRSSGVSVPLIQPNSLLTVEPYQPVWTGDQMLLVTLSSEGGSPALYQLDASQLGEALPQEVVPNAANPAFNAERGIIAFERAANGTRNIYTANADGGSVLPVTNTDLDCHSPVFNRDNLLFICENERGSGLFQRNFSGIQSVNLGLEGIADVSTNQGRLVLISNGNLFLATPDGAQVISPEIDTNLRFTSVSTTAN